MNRRVVLRGGLCTAVGILAGFGVTMGLSPQDALARGAGAEESAKARRLLEQSGATGQGKTVSSPTGTFKLAPGETLTFQVDGYCLDSDRALPSDDEPMAFRPMQRYIAPELRKLYIAIMRKVAAGAPSGVRVQQIVYAIRNEASERYGTLKDDDYRFLNAVLPNGEAVLKKAPRPAEFVSGMGLSLWASQPMPGEHSGYSMLSGAGVAGRGVGMGALEVNCTVHNGSPQPFTFDTTQWVLESSRDVQAVALPVASRYTLIAGRPVTPKEPGPSKKEPDVSQPDKASPRIQPDANGYVGY